MCNEVLELLDDPTAFGHTAAELRPVLLWASLSPLPLPSSRRYEINALVGFGPDSPPDSDGTPATYNFDLEEYESALSRALAMLNKARGNSMLLLLRWSSVHVSCSRAAGYPPCTGVDGPV